MSVVVNVSIKICSYMGMCECERQRRVEWDGGAVE